MQARVQATDRPLPGSPGLQRSRHGFDAQPAAAHRLQMAERSLSKLRVSRRLPIHTDAAMASVSRYWEGACASFCRANARSIGPTREQCHVCTLNSRLQALHWPTTAKTRPIKAWEPTLTGAATLFCPSRQRPAAPGQLGQPAHQILTCESSQSSAQAAFSPRLCADSAASACAVQPRPALLHHPLSPAKTVLCS